MDTILIVVVIIAIILIIGILLLSVGKKQAPSTPPGVGDPITYLPETGIGYKIMTGEVVDISNIVKDDEFFTETWFVRDRINNWDGMFNAAHSSNSRKFGTRLESIDEAMKRISDAMYTFINGRPAVAPLVIERQQSGGVASNAAIIVYDDASTTVSRIDILRILPGLAALVDLDPTNIDLKNQLALAYATAVKPVNSTVDLASSIGGLVTPNGSTTFISNSFYISNLDSGYALGRFDRSTLKMIDEIRQTDGEISIDYAFMIPFEDGGLEICQYQGGDTRFVISNFWSMGTIKSYWYCDGPDPASAVVCTAGMTDAGILITGSPDTLTVDEKVVTLHPTDDDSKCFFNIFDKLYMNESVMYKAASGKYDPTRQIITSVYAGIGFIANLINGNFAAQSNLQDPTSVLDFTDAPYKFSFDVVEIGTVEDAIITLPEGAGTTYGVLSQSTIDELVAAIINSATPPPETSIINKE